MGLIDDTASPENLKELVNHRSVAAIPFASRYRLIDFPLSNMVNSGIRNVGIFTQTKNRSLLEHVGSGQDWDLSGKRDGLFILPPMFEQSDHYKRLGDVDYYHKHRDYIAFSRQEYILITNTRSIYNFDLNGINNFYFENFADIVMVYTKKQGGDSKFITLMDINPTSKKVEDIMVNTVNPKDDNVFCNILFMRKSLFLDIVDSCVSRGFNDLIKDGIIPRLKKLRVLGYQYKGFYGEVNDPMTYYKLNKELLDPDRMKYLFNGQTTILTRVQNEPPAKYCESSDVSNSLIANGCLIEGTVENSILFRGVKVEKGAVVKDSIIMQKGVIGRNSTIENTILDKNVVISPNTQIISPSNYPFVIERRSQV